MKELGRRVNEGAGEESELKELGRRVNEAAGRRVQKELERRKE